MRRGSRAPRGPCRAAARVARAVRALLAARRQATALISCPDCRKRVSDLAPACPNCGRPIAGHAVTPRRDPDATPPDGWAFPEPIKPQTITPPSTTISQGLESPGAWARAHPVKTTLVLFVAAGLWASVSYIGANWSGVGSIHTSTSAGSSSAPQSAKPVHVRLAEFDGRSGDAEGLRVALQNLRRQCAKNNEEQIGDVIYTGWKRHREWHRSQISMLEVATALDSLTASLAGLGDVRSGDCVQSMTAWLYLERR